jgi:hypothetical protein
MKNNKDEIEYLMLFCAMHQEFLINKIRIKPQFKNYYVDYENWKINTDGTGSANIWIEPKVKLIYKPVFKSPFPEIEIKGLLITVKTKMVAETKNNKTVSFEIAGTFNPHNWGGRNAKELQPIGETVITGHNRVVLERDQIFSTYFLKYITQNYADFIVKSVKFFT